MLVGEIEEALAKRFPGVAAKPFQLVGRGVAFAFDQPPTELQIPPRAYELHSVGYIEAVRQATLDRFERSCLTGEAREGEMMPPMPANDHAGNFMKFVSTLAERFSVISTKQWADGLVGVSMVDILEPLEKTLEAHGISLSQLLALGKDGVSSFMQDLPSRRVDMHLQRQVLRNPSLRPKRTDLEDWGALGPAAAHCDALVCEKHFASLLRRDDFEPRARILTNLGELPSVFRGT
jgi:hypothetical protein